MEHTTSTATRHTKPRERNSLLKKYYGLKDANVAIASQVVEEKSDPLNIGTIFFSLRMCSY